MKAKNGISLIVLVITIVVIIILAAAVILSLGDNNPINSAKTSQLVSNKDNIQSAILNCVATRAAKYAATDDDVSPVHMLSKAPAVISATANTITLKSTSVSATDVKVYEITDFSKLDMQAPDLGTWYFGDDGKVYVKLSTALSYENESTKVFTIDALTAVSTN